MTTIDCKYNKAKRQIVWMLSGRNESYTVVLQLTARGNFEHLAIPIIKSKRIARSLDLVLQEVAYLNDFGVKQFIKEYEL